MSAGEKECRSNRVFIIAEAEGFCREKLGGESEVSIDSNRLTTICPIKCRFLAPHKKSANHKTKKEFGSVDTAPPRKPR